MATADTDTCLSTIHPIPLPPSSCFLAEPGLCLDICQLQAVTCFRMTSSLAPEMVDTFKTNSISFFWTVGGLNVSMCPNLANEILVSLSAPRRFLSL